MKPLAKIQVTGLLVCVVACQPVNTPDSVAEHVPKLDRAAQAITQSSVAAYWAVPGVQEGGTFKRTWDGATADLLAADALVSCWSSLPSAIRDPGSGAEHSSFANAHGFGDPVVSGIVSKMGAAICPARMTPTPNPWEPRTAQLFTDWMAARMDPTCSFDPASGMGRTLNLQSSRPSLAASDWTPPVDVPAPALREAEAELAYADLYLCMTQRLVEHTQSSFVFDAGAEEVLRLYDLARNRALLTVFQYSLLAKVFAADAVQLAGVPTAQYGTLAALKNWADTRSAGELAAIGRDMALAIDTLADLTQRQVALLRRDVSRERSDEPRQQILRALYGDAAPSVSRIEQDLSAPEIAVLLGMARQADALDLLVKVQDTAGTGSIEVDGEASARALLRAAERQYRLQSCPEGDAHCAAGGLPDDFTAYHLYNAFGIGPDHARRLVGAVAEALFGGAKSPNDWRYDEHVVVPPGIGRPIKLAAAQSATCGLFDQGRVACWGTGLQQPNAGPNWIERVGGTPLENVADIVAASQHACALTQDGEVLCWGAADGSSRAPSRQAASVPGLPSVVSEPVRELSARLTTTCAVTTAGNVYCWGTSATVDAGALGDGSSGRYCSVLAAAKKRGNLAVSRAGFLAAA
jgi:hypothetical protein